MGVGSKARLSAPVAGSLAQAWGCPTVRVSQKSQQACVCWRDGLVSHVAKSFGPACGQVSAANLLGRAGKFATVQRERCCPASPKKRMAGPRSGGHGLSSAGGRTSAWPLRAGVVFYFRRLPKNLTTSPRFCQGSRLQLNFQPLFSSSAGSAPMQWANICAQGTG